jgi:hypothetical protein
MEPLPLLALAFAGFLTGIYAWSRTLASIPGFNSTKFRLARPFRYLVLVSFGAPLLGWIINHSTHEGLAWGLLVTAIITWIWVLTLLYDARNA